MDVEFSNGATRTYERLNSKGRGAVLVIPMLDDDTVLMIYEFSGGTERYELGLTKGKIDVGETPVEAAQRELKEEIGYGANKLPLPWHQVINPIRLILCWRKICMSIGKKVMSQNPLKWCCTNSQTLKSSLTMRI
jgi:8-oxo-dGTP pyrophosphatase MutT (NUDIX family)